MPTFILFEPDPTRAFGPDLGLFLGGKFPLFSTEFSGLDQLTFTVAEYAPTQIIVKWNGIVENLAPLTTPSNYVIVPLAGQPALTVTSVSFTPGTSIVILHLSGRIQGGNYQVNIAANTASTTTGLNNAAANDTFLGVQSVRRPSFNGGFD